MILDLGNMKVLEEKDIEVHYIVLKIDGKTYSTSFEEIKTGKDVKVSKEQLVDTIGIGKQNNTWIKGEFTETSDHQKLNTPMQFELNIYTEK